MIVEVTTIEPARGYRSSVRYVVRCDACDADGPSSQSRQRARTDALCAGWAERVEVSGKVEHRCTRCDHWSGTWAARGAA